MPLSKIEAARVAAAIELLDTTDAAGMASEGIGLAVKILEDHAPNLFAPATRAALAEHYDNLHQHQRTDQPRRALAILDNVVRRRGHGVPMDRPAIDLALRALRGRVEERWLTAFWVCINAANPPADADPMILPIFRSIERRLGSGGD